MVGGADAKQEGTVNRLEVAHETIRSVASRYAGWQSRVSKVALVALDSSRSDMKTLVADEDLRNLSTTKGSAT